MSKSKRNPVHPGQVLLDEFIAPMGLNQHRVALAIGVPARRINGIVHQNRGITTDSALRLAKFFGNSPQYWLELQMQYDLQTLAPKLSKELDRIPRAKSK